MSASVSTSFQKKTRTKVVQIPGCKPSLHNNQLLVSSGIPSFDNVIGGGLAVGTVLLVEEDVFGSYSQLMLKYFLAEGVVNKHDLFIGSCDEKPEQIIKKLPCPLVDDPGAEPAPKGEADENMKIAWRYQNLPKVQSSPAGTRFGHYYDLTKTMDSQTLENVNQTFFSADTCDCCSERSEDVPMNPAYNKLLSSIKEHIANNHFATSDTSQQRNILRIGIHSLGSPQWGEQGGSHPNQSGYDPSLCRFLYALRGLARSSYVVFLITIPSHLFQDEAFSHRARHLCDTVVQLDSFAGSDKEKNPVFKEYHGLFHIKKLPRLNSLTCYMPDTLDLAFKLRRKKFTIEKLHLPPELSETASRSQGNTTSLGSGSGCGSSGGSSKLDF